MSTELHILAFIAPLLKPKVLPEAFEYNCYFDLEKNDINNARYDDIVSVLGSHVLVLQDLTTYWRFFLDNVNLTLYTDDFIFNMSSADAEIVLHEVFNSSNYNMWEMPHVCRDIYNLINMIDNCLSLLNKEFITITTMASSSCECIVDGTYHSYSVQYYVPASIASYDYLKTNCDYNYGLSSQMRTILEDYTKHLDKNVPWDKIFCYKLGTNAIAPEKATFETVGFTMYATELQSTNGNILTYKTNLTLVPPTSTDNTYYFEFHSTQALVDAEYSLLSPNIIYTPNEIIFKVQKINAEAAALTLPFPMAKFLVKRALLHVPNETMSPDIEVGPSN